MSQQLLTSQKVDELLKFVRLLPTSGVASESKQEEFKSNSEERFYLTTAINYTNGRPHIGHAYEAVTSDVIARYHRIYGRNVWFLTGTDEHGQKVANTAESKGKTPKAFCDENVSFFKKLNEKLQISNDRFIRTTDTDHYKLAAKMFSTAYENGDIYKSQYEGWYDVRNERFLTETQAKDSNYIDPISKKPYTKQSEETYFFRMSKYQKRLLNHIKANPLCIEPVKSYQFILRKLSDETLHDLCVSRSTFDWGIPVPIDDKHVIYVWFDALSNYLTGIDYFGNADLHNFWPCNVHLIGKDIVWFHTVIWPCILMSCGIELPNKVFCHGFVMDKNGEKMSKSAIPPNVVDPFEVLTRYNPDSIRYFICTQGTFGNDMRWNESDLEKRHDAHLAHIYGNLVNRALKLCKKNNKGKIPSYDDGKSIGNIFDLKKLINETEMAYKSYDLSRAAELAMNALRECNDWITKREPWKMKAKEQKTEKLSIIRAILECIYVLTHFMEPFTPRAAEQTFKDLNHKRSSIREIGFKNFENLSEGRKIKMGKVLFVQHSRKHERQIENANKPVIARVEFKIGEIKAIDNHEKDERLYVETIDLGESKPRMIVSGLAKYYPNKNDLLGKKVIVFANLKFSKFKGIESQGMVMCATDKESGEVRVLDPPKNAVIGQRLIWRNSKDYKADEKINIGKKNSFWKKDIVGKLLTDGKGNMAFDGEPFKTEDGQLVTSPFPNGQIS